MSDDVHSGGTGKVDRSGGGTWARHEAPGTGDPGSGAPPVTVVVPVLDAVEYLPRCVPAVLRAVDRIGGGEIVFVDNGSTDGSVEFLRARCGDRATILRRPDGNVGEVRNVGAAHGTGRFLAFVDADCVVSEDCFERALDVLRRTGADATGSTYALPSDPHWVERTWFRLHTRRVNGYVTHLNAGNFFCRRAAFEDVGGFDPELESGEDAELCQRLDAAGHPIYEAHEVEAVHLGNPKSARDFFAKQRWHGRGALGTFRRNWLDKPLLGTVAHALLLVLGLVALVGAGSWSGVAAATVAWLVVPGAAVVYRMLEVRRWVDPVAAVVLYWLYFAARGVALIELGVDSVKGRIGGRRPAPGREQQAAEDGARGSLRTRRG